MKYKIGYDYAAGAVFILLLLLLLILIHQKRKRERERFLRLKKIGDKGEDETIQNLEGLAKGCRILRNLYVPLADGTATVEIDAVILHKKGIFVLENKNYSGKICVREDDKYWLRIQKTDGRRWSSQLYNPIWQNQGHIRHLKQYLNLDLDIPFISVITFNDRARLSGRRRVHSREICLSESRKVRRRLRWKLLWMPRRLSNREVKQLCERLEALTHPGHRTEKQHGRYIKKVRSRG